MYQKKSVKKVNRCRASTAELLLMDADAQVSIQIYQARSPYPEAHHIFRPLQILNR